MSRASFVVVAWDGEPWERRCALVLEHVGRERQRQVARYGHNETLLDGTGPDAAWLFPMSSRPATEIEAGFRVQYREHERKWGEPTWMHLVREEVAEAFLEDDPARLREELIQVAALCVSWVEKLDRRADQ